MNRSSILCPTVNPKSKNILFLISSIGGGGAERVACHLVSNFSKNHNVHLMYFNKKQNTYPISPNVKLIPFFSEEIQSIQDWSNIQDANIIRMFEIEKVRRRYEIDITISFLFLPNILNVNSGGDTIKILSERNDPEGKGDEYYKEMISAYEKADKVVFQTNYAKNKFSSEIKNKSVIIPNPICVSCLADKNPKKKIVSVGRLVPQKNHELLIKSFSIFHRFNKEYSLHIYGIGPLLDELKSLVNELNLNNHVFFEGFCDNVHERIKDAEIFILSSDYEGMPNSLMEAMMMGLPCISTNCSGVPEIIENEKNGLLVEKGDKSDLARAILLLSEDKLLREKIKKNAMRKAEEWKLEKIMKKWESLFD